MHPNYWFNVILAIRFALDRMHPEILIIANVLIKLSAIYEPRIRHSG